MCIQIPLPKGYRVVVRVEPNGSVEVKVEPP